MLSLSEMERHEKLVQQEIIYVKYICCSFINYHNFLWGKVEEVKMKTIIQKVTKLFLCI